MGYLHPESGEWIQQSWTTHVQGREALAALWGDLPGYVERSIESVEFLGGDVAKVRVTVLDEPAIGRHHEWFVVVKESGTWLIRAHQTVD